MQAMAVTQVGSQGGSHWGVRVEMLRSDHTMYIF